MHPQETKAVAEPTGDNAGGGYFSSLMGLLGSPRSFFSELPPAEGFRTPFQFLLFSALFHSGAFALTIAGHKTLMTIVVFLNALLMPLAAAVAGFIVCRMTTRRGLSFAVIFQVYAYSAGVTLLVSWIPLFSWFTEPWKWILITLGLRKTARMGWGTAAVVLAGSMALVFLFFYSLNAAVPVLLKN